MQGGKEEQTLPLIAYRNYLMTLVRVELDPVLQGKLDLSGVVQQTLLEAHQAFADMEGKKVEEVAAWLRRILANNLTDAIRKLKAKVRDVFRERSLEAALEQSSLRLEKWLAAEQTSPSQFVQKKEQILLMAACLARLPEDQRTALEMHHLQGLPLIEVGQRMERSPSAVAGLIFRGLRSLREMMDSSPE